MTQTRSLDVPTLRGADVVLRAWRDTDAGVVLAVAEDPLIPSISSVQAGGGIDSALAFVARQRQRAVDGQGWAFAVAATENDAALGFVGLFWRDRDEGRASIGYWTGPESRRRGLTTRAVRVASAWALEQPGLMRLEAYIEPWNTGSIRVSEGAGFECEGLMKSFAPIGGRRMDALLYARVD